MRSFVTALLIIATFALIACRKPAGPVHPVGPKEYYAQANLWINGKKLSAVNHRSGDILLTVGSRVKIVESGPKRYKIVNLDSGDEFYFINHKSWGDITAAFDAFFGKNPEKEIEKLEEKDQAEVKKGGLVEGMHKDAVLLSIGPPPPHKTPSLSSQTWKYWLGRAKTFEVKFNDKGIVTQIIGLKDAPEPVDHTPKDLWFSKVNLRIYDGDTVDWRNWQTGPIIPLNTRVEVLDKGNSSVEFKVLKSGEKYTYNVDTDHCGKKAWDMWQIIFDRSNQESELKKLSKFDRDGAKGGEVKVGMSKTAVFMALGLPPPHKTASLSSSTWLYWKSRTNKFRVFFGRNDKVKRVED